MAAIASAANGLWNTGGTWVGGVAPTAADTVTITHTVTLDGACDCLTGIVNSPGIVQASQLVNSELRWKGPGNFLFNTGTSLRADLSAFPALTFKIRPQYASASENVNSHLKFAANGIPSLKGAYRKRVTRIQGAQASGSSGTRSITVDDATGWQIGDRLFIVSTQTGVVNGNRNDRVTITNITGGPLNAVIDVDLAITPIVYSKLTRAYIANESSNVMMADESGRTARLVITSGTAGAIPGLLQDVAFIWTTGGRGYSGDGYTVVTNSNSSYQTFTGGGIRNCAFSATVALDANMLDERNTYIPYTRSDNLFTNTAVVQTGAINYSNNVTTYACGDDLRPAAFGLQMYGTVSPRAGRCIDALIGGSTGGGTAATDGTVFLRCKFWGMGGSTFNQSLIGCKFTECEYEVEFASLVGYRFMWNGGTFSDVVHENCLYGNYTTDINSNALNYTPPYKLFLQNKNQDSNQQEGYTLISATTPTLMRDTSLVVNSDASMMVQAIGTTYTPAYWQSFLATPGVSYVIKGSVRYDNSAGNANPPRIFSNSANVTITGTGVSGNVWTCPSGINTWQPFELTISHANAYAIPLNLTYDCRSSSASTVKAYFDGVPDYPWVQVARHYGYMFDDRAYRTVNPSIQASLATASGYTGVTIGWGTSSSTTTLGANHTIQEVYDSSQYQSALAANMLKIPPFTGVGLAGAVSLFTTGNVVTSGYTLNGSGSLTLGAYSLTGTVPWNYSYTGGTFSQSTTVPNFSGGTLAIGNGGTYTFSTSSSILMTVTPSGSASYSLGAGTFTGTLTVNNTTATPVTVFVPAGVSTSSAGNTGGAITFSAPTVQQSVTITNVVAGSRVQIYDLTNSIELFNGTSGYSWTDPSPAVAPRAIRVRIAYVNGTSAKQFVEANIGTCGTTAPSNAVSYLASQVNDTPYNSNAVDGSTITGITIVEGATDRVQISIAGGTVTWASIYAYQCYWLFDAVGIQDDGAFISAPDTANYILTGFKIKNTHGSIPLVITGGYGVDSTGSVSVLYDTTGTSIFPAPAHVVPYAVGSGVTAGDITSIAAASATAVTTAPATLTVAKFIALKD